MDTQFYNALDAVQEQHWWYAARRTILERVLEQVHRQGVPPGKLFDLGCGVGANLPVLERFGETVGIDTSSDAIEFCRRRGRFNVQLGNLDDLTNVEQGSASVAVLADVIEHLDSEAPCLAATHRILAPGGALVVTVPAYMFLWGPSDVMSHHKRRYTASQLRRVIEPGFQIQHLTYFNTFLFGLVAAGRFGEALLRRRGDDMAKLPPSALNRVLEAIFRAEAGIVPRHSLPFGVSLLCVARRR